LTLLLLAGLLPAALLLLARLLLAAALLLAGLLIALLLLTGFLVGVLVLVHSISFQRWFEDVDAPRPRLRQRTGAASVPQSTGTRHGTRQPVAKFPLKEQRSRG
jgi:hypothetical protein